MEWMKPRKHWAYQIVQLHGCDTFVNSRDDLLGDGGGIDMIWVQAIAQSGHTCCDLVELYSFLAVVCHDQMSVINL